ncbi:hypothetical protein PTTG_00345 [Puccinia triticina 1-1 BBBD Race 1]|uniref:HAT C-terminal dimerisation domain-containing protein n=1 Tax=Puccinia triticina (isolate 1-1 / race 1 (BBBD)) TaxID=630390 RepID=A0A0C4EHX9_PUCT1|nr:hypothetical protein PTTG_00345 [Puccinia triticina 1-1 BBBD Race 1]
MLAFHQITDIHSTSTVLHPSFKDEYFKLANWQPEWIEESIRLTREMWESYYKPAPQPSSSQPPISCPKKGVLAGLVGASEARGGKTMTDPIHLWLAGGLSLTDDGQPVNPLKWWMQEHRSGNTHGGLLQMALDVLSCPGEFCVPSLVFWLATWLTSLPLSTTAATVDVERSFSFGRDYISLRRHRLSASSVTKGMAVAFYSKNGKMKPGVLHKWKVNLANETKHKGKGKSARKV